MKTISSKELNRFLEGVEFHTGDFLHEGEAYDLQVDGEVIRMHSQPDFDEITLTQSQQDVIWAEVGRAYLMEEPISHDDNYDTLGINPQDFL